MHTLGRALRALGHAAFVVLIVVVAVFPLPVMPIVLALQRRRRHEVATQIDRTR